MRGRTSSRALVARQLAGLLLLAMLGAATHAQVAWEPDPWEPADPPLPFVSITPIGFRLFRDEFLRLVAPLPGQPYDPVLLRKVLDATVKIYRDAGYRFASLREPAITEFEDGYYVRVRIDEGRVGEITVTGLRRTREDVITRQLLLVPGELYIEEDRVESERILRERAYVGDVTVTPALNETTGEIDIVVDVRDLWSLVPKARLVGGVADPTWRDVLNGDVGLQVTLEDANLSGTGQDWFFSFRREQPDIAHEANGIPPFRNRIGVRVFDPNAFQSRWQIAAAYEQQARPDVDAWALLLRRPLYSLRSKWSFEFLARERGEITEFQRDGVLLREWERRVKSQFAATTFVSGPPDRQMQYTFWVSHKAEDYELSYSDAALPIVEDTGFFSTRNTSRRYTVSPEAVPLLTEALGGVRLTYQRLRYIKARNVDRLGRTEDIGLGNTLTVSLGGGLRSLGNDRDEARPTVAYAYARRLGEHGLMQLSLGARTPYVLRNGRDGSRGLQNVVVTGAARGMIRGGDSRAIVWRVQAESLSRNARDRNLLLDRRNGVRGYSRRSFDGKHRLVVNVEGRQVVWEHSYVVTQAVVFADHGYAWWDDFDAADARSTVGTGLRLGLQRLASPAVRVDLAYPIDGAPPQWKWSFGTGQYF
jgi:hypothetical protein